MAIKKRNSANNEKVKYNLKSIFPWFILGFILTSLMNSVGIIGKDMTVYLSELGKFLIIMALTAVGLSADLKKLLKAGLKPLLLGLIVWFAVTVSSIAVQFVSGSI